MQSTNPYTQEVIQAYIPMTQSEVNKAIEHTESAFQQWKQTTFEERKTLVLALADTLQRNKTTYANLATQEMGKVTSEAIAEIEKCALNCSYYANNAASMLADEPVTIENRESMITYQPLGAILAVMPWNFPFWQVIRFLAPALMAGNACVLKHASNVTGCALAIEEAVRTSGFPEHLCTTLIIPSQEVASVIHHPLIRAVTLTGSTQAGKSVAKEAGVALKKTVLELGGSDPYIILKDANLELAAKTCTTSRMINAGQSCIAAKRFIVTEQVYDPFIKLFQQEIEAISYGDPTEKHTQIGPLASLDHRYQLHRQVQASIDQGASCLTGGTLLENQNAALYPPTLLTDIKPGMPAYDDELFGPVASVIRAQDEEEALNIANNSPFGLGAAIFSKDTEKAKYLAKHLLDCGNIAINDFVKSDPRLPFGGIKESGYGRELSTIGIREFVNIKSIVVQKDP